MSLDATKWMLEGDTQAQRKQRQIVNLAAAVRGIPEHVIGGATVTRYVQREEVEAKRLAKPSEGG